MVYTANTILHSLKALLLYQLPAAVPM